MFYLIACLSSIHKSVVGTILDASKRYVQCSLVMYCDTDDKDNLLIMNEYTLQDSGQVCEIHCDNRLL